jgi:hypothetical protein
MGCGCRLTILFGGLRRGQYYVNTETGESTWDHPSQLAGRASAGQWALRVSKSTGEMYYFNNATGESSWDPDVARSASAPAGAEELGALFAKADKGGKGMLDAGDVTALVCRRPTTPTLPRTTSPSWPCRPRPPPTPHAPTGPVVRVRRRDGLH